MSDGNSRDTQHAVIKSDHAMYGNSWMMMLVVFMVAAVIGPVVMMWIVPFGRVLEIVNAGMMDNVGVMG